MSLLQRVAAGDRQAMSECIAHFGPLIWSMARRMLSDRSEAEDAVQEAFIDVWRHADRFNPARGSEATFVAMIARRRFIDRLRRGRPHRGRLSLSDVDEPGDGHGPSQRLEQDEQMRLAMEAFVELKPQQQRVLAMAVFDGHSHAQIAQSTGLPLGTVKAHVRRGLARLRQILSRAEQGADGERSR